jgi:hypothetical protein
VFGQIAGVIYEAQLGPNQHVCYGGHCHFWVFVFLLCSMAIAVGATFWLTLILPQTEVGPNQLTLLPKASEDEERELEDLNNDDL